MRRFIPLLLMALLVGPSTQAQENMPDLSLEVGDVTVRLGGSLRLRYENWIDGDVLPGQGPRYPWARDRNDEYLLTNFRLNLDIVLDDRWRIFVEGEYAEVGSNHNDGLDRDRLFSSDVHLQQAFVEYSGDGHRARIGRQVLSYGSRMIIGNDRFINNQRSYDVARFDWSSEDFELSLFGGQQAFESHPDELEPDNVVAGYYATKFLGGWQLDQYALYRDSDHDATLAPDLDTEIFWLGGRVKNSWTRFELDIDAVKQAGDSDGWATHGQFTYFMAPDHYSDPQLFTTINVASGGQSVEDNYVPFEPAAHLVRQSTALSPYVNIQEYGVGLSANPVRDSSLFVRGTFFSMYKFDREGGIYSADELVWAGPTDNRHLGYYAALIVEYELPSTGAVLTGCFSRYFAEDAIDEFDRPGDRIGDTTFIYFSLLQRF